MRSLLLLLYHPGAHAQSLQHPRLLELSYFNVLGTPWTPHRPLRFHSDFRVPDHSGGVPTEADGLFWGVVNALGGEVFPLGSAKGPGRNELVCATIDDRDLIGIYKRDQTKRFHTCGRGDGVVCAEESTVVYPGDDASTVVSLVFGHDDRVVPED